jgi:hypothetical protein
MGCRKYNAMLIAPMFDNIQEIFRVFMLYFSSLSAPRIAHGQRSRG